jgi:hypothetical protein
MQQLGQFMPRECEIVFAVARMSEAISGTFRCRALIPDVAALIRATNSQGAACYRGTVILRCEPIRRASKDVPQATCSQPSFEARESAHLRMTAECVGASGEACCQRKDATASPELSASCAGGRPCRPGRSRSLRGFRASSAASDAGRECRPARDCSRDRSGDASRRWCRNRSWCRRR